MTCFFVFCLLTGSWVSGFAVVYHMKLWCHFVSLIHKMAVSVNPYYANHVPTTNQVVLRKVLW